MQNLQSVIDNNVTLIGAMLMTMSDILEYSDKNSVKQFVDSMKTSLDKFIIHMRKEKECINSASKSINFNTSETFPVLNSRVAAVSVRQRRVEPRSALKSAAAKDAVNSRMVKPTEKKLELKIKWKKLTQDDEMKIYLRNMLVRLGTYWTKWERCDLRIAWAKLKSDFDSDDETTELEHDSDYVASAKLNASLTQRRRHPTREAPVVAHAFGSSYPLRQKTEIQQRFSPSHSYSSSRFQSLLQSPSAQSCAAEFCLPGSSYEDYGHSFSTTDSMPLLASDLHEFSLFVPGRSDGSDSQGVVVINEDGSDQHSLKHVSSSETLNELLQRDATYRQTQQRPGEVESDISSNAFDRDSEVGDHDSSAPSPLDSSTVATTVSPELFDAETGEAIHSAGSAVAMLFSSIQNSSACGEIPTVRTVDDYWLGAEPISTAGFVVAPSQVSTVSVISHDSDVNPDAAESLKETTVTEGLFDYTTKSTAEYNNSMETPVSTAVVSTPPVTGSPIPAAMSMSEWVPRTSSSISVEAELEAELNAIRESFFPEDGVGLRRYTPSSSGDFGIVTRIGNSGNNIGMNTPSEEELQEELAAIRRQSCFSAAHLLPLSQVQSNVDRTWQQKHLKSIPDVDAAAAVATACPVVDTAFADLDFVENRDSLSLDYFDCDSLVDGVELPP